MRAKGIYLLYRVLQVLAGPAVFFYFALRAARSAQYRRAIPERLGLLPSSFAQIVPGCIWLHAVSVGEIIASIELIRTLRRELPNIPVYVSAGTTAGYAMAVDKLGEFAGGVFYAPVDYVFAVRRVLRKLGPAVVVVLETEIWPNLFREARRAGAAVLVVNGRISDRTAKRYAGLRWFFGPVLDQVSRILAQSPADRERYLAAGASPERTEDAGNLKYDFEPREAPADSPVRAWLAARSGMRVWIAASTTADERMAEEDAVLEAIAALEGWVLILAPRKPDRFDEVAAKITARGLEFARRSKISADAPGRILLLDTIGELAGLFPLADVVFMGGTLADRGGHNILEPATFGKPVITGPHLENFRSIAADFLQHQAVITIEDGKDLSAAVAAASGDRDTGQRGRARALAHRGATVHAARVIREFHVSSLPRAFPSLDARVFLTPLAWVWRKGGEWRTRKALRDPRRLDAPAISVGNITTGGTGKTPFVAWLARRLHDDGRRPGILTRGYGRQSHENILAVQAGGKAPVSQTGDEAQILLRTGNAALGIAADRYTVGRILRARFGVDILLLDDGFQHRRLHRDLDIVLIDALAPFGNEELVPLGRLREPLEGLGRADAFVITRAAVSRIVPAIERKLREFNPRAPIFHAATVADTWVEYATGHEYHAPDLADERAIAFCALGNPQSFWRTLGVLGITPLETLEYDDHHSYRMSELRCLAQLARDLRATVLLTTEKDAVNLCEDGLLILQGVKLLWLKIDMEITEEAALMALVAGVGEVRGTR